MDDDTDSAQDTDTSYETGNGDNYGSDDTSGGDSSSESESDGGGSLGVEDASFVHPPSEWGQRMGQMWSGIGDWAEGTASSAVHLGEYAYDSVTGDDAAADKRVDDMGNDLNQIIHGVQEVADLM